MGVTIKQVAKEANVSVSTVSRALNGYSDINEDTKQNILSICSSLGYFPNKNAKSLSSKSNKNVGVIISELFIDNPGDGFILSLIKGAYSYLSSNGMNVSIIATSTSEQNNKSFDKLCQENSLSGGVLLGLKTTDPYINQLKDIKHSCVTIDLEVEGDNVKCVLIDDEKAFEDITQLTIDKGHRDLILVFGTRESRVAQKRYNGFLKAIKRNSINIEDVEIFDTNFYEEIAYQTAKELITKKGKSLGTVFICMSDLIAVGILRAIIECGYKCPEDFAITGFDGSTVANYVTPAITTVSQDVFDKGFRAGKLLLDLINNEPNINDEIAPYTLKIQKSL